MAKNRKNRVFRIANSAVKYWWRELFPPHSRDRNGTKKHQICQKIKYKQLAAKELILKFSDRNFSFPPQKTECL